MQPVGTPELWRGCKIRPSITSTIRNGFVQPDTLPETGWSKYSIPTFNQLWPSCVGQASANWLEHMLRRYIGMDVLAPNEQLDGDAFWRKAREMFYADEDGIANYTDGILLDQAFLAMIELGALPKGTHLGRVPTDWNRIYRQLKRTPLIQAHIVHQGWFACNRENGQIGENHKVFPWGGGHATLMVEALTQQRDGVHHHYVMSQNSWGREYGYHGYFLMSLLEWEQCYIDGPMYAEMPDGWKEWRGWENFVITMAA